MRKTLAVTAAALVASALAAPAGAVDGNASLGRTLTLDVPVVCRVLHRGEASAQGEGFALGQLTEYCNAAGGFSVYVDYTPGTLKGATIKLGETSVLLDGSGHSEVMSATGPRIQTLDLAAQPGAGGFDSGFLTFGIEPR